MDLLVKAIILGLAGWRIANMLVNEEGPGLIFERLRDVVGLKPGEISGFIPSLFSCVFCMTVWTTSFMWFLWLISPEAVMLMAAWALALVCHSVAGAGDH